MRKLIVNAAQLAARYLPSRAKLALYRFRPFADLIRLQLNLAVPAGMTDVRVAGGELVGMHMRLDLQAEKDYWLGTYEADLQEALKELVEPGMVAYDVGANIGFTTLLLAKRVGEDGRVYAFEALPANLERLNENVALNDLDANVIIVPKAVVNAQKSTRFLVGPSGGMGKAEGSLGRQGVAYHETITVDGVSLDGYVYESGNPPPQVIKMDIEGGEVLALPGMERLLDEVRPVLLIELHGHEAAEIAWSTLSEAGYQLHKMAPGFPRIPSIDALDWKSYLVAAHVN
jgi:FkbM family methyltransferase